MPPALRKRGVIMRKKLIVILVLLSLTSCATRVVTIREPVYIPVPSGGETVRRKDPQPPKVNDTNESTNSKYQTNSEPPFVLKIWLYIHHGRVYQHRLYPISYPGRIRKFGDQKTNEGYVETFISEYNPEVKWRMLLPRNDGEYNCNAYLVR
jgi:hypothetical protein